MSSYLVAQLTDVHLTESGSLPNGARTGDNLADGLALIDQRHLRPDVILLTGDLADAGAGACYEELADAVAASAAARDATVVYLPGNHDQRGPFRRHLLGEEGRPGEGPINQTHWRGGLRILAVDSTVPGEDHGWLDDETLAYIDAELATPAPDGTVLALHHPPIPSPIQLMTQMALRAPERLREVIDGTDVRIVLAGHNHHVGLGMLGTVPVWVSPATAYLADVTSTEVFRGVPGSAFSRIDIADGGVTASVVPIH